MTGNFVSLSSKDFNSILEHPDRAIRLIELQVEDAAASNQRFIDETRRLSTDPKISPEVRERYTTLLHRIEADFAAISEADDGWKPGPDAKSLDIDKSWDSLNALLTLNEPEDSPLGFILSGGCGIPNDDFGYGPPHGFTAEETKEIAAKLEGIESGKLIALENLKEFEDRDLYCFSGDEDDLEYLQTYFDELKLFVAEAAKAGQALVVFLA